MVRRERLEKTTGLMGRADLAAGETRYWERSADDFGLFLRGLVIPSASGPRLFADCVQPFQVEAFDFLRPSLMAVRDGTVPVRRRFWIERTKKAAKDADLAICLLWLMAFPKRPILVQVSAADQEQAGIIKKRVEDLLFYNPWLNKRLLVQRNLIYGYNRLGRVQIEATGRAGGKQGPTPDLLVLNELVHVERWSVNEAHMNNADGVPQGVAIVSTNAGIKGTKAWAWKQNAINNSEKWTVCEWKQLAPWVNAEDVEDARRRDPLGAEFDRLWRGLWVSGTGDAVSQRAIDGCFREGASFVAGPEEGWRYLAGFDLGVSHDHSGVVLLGIQPEEQRVKVCWLKGFEPTKLGSRDKLEVDIKAVESACLRLHREWPLDWFGYDPAAGGSFLAQRLREEGLPMDEVSFASATNQTAMATTFVQLVEAGRLECYEDEEDRLRRDFGKFSIEHSVARGYRLTAVSDAWGHADVGTAIVLCLPQARALMGGDFGGWGEAQTGIEALDNDPPTADELAEWPEHIQRLINQEDEPLEYEKRRGSWD